MVTTWQQSYLVRGSQSIDSCQSWPGCCRGAAISVRRRGPREHSAQCVQAPERTQCQLRHVVIRKLRWHNRGRPLPSGTATVQPSCCACCTCIRSTCACAGRTLNNPTACQKQKYVSAMPRPLRNNSACQAWQLVHAGWHDRVSGTVAKHERHGRGFPGARSQIQ